MLARRILAAARITSLDPDAQILIDAMSVSPPMNRAVLISDHIITKKDIGSWQESDIYYMMAAHHEQVSRLNWKSPGNFTLTANGDITFTVDRGWQGDGSTGYLDTGWIPATHGVNYTLNDASFGVYSRTDTQTFNEIDIGAFQSAGIRSFLQIRNTENQTRYNVHVGSNVRSPLESVMDGRRLSVARRTGEANSQALKNGTILDSSTEASTGMPNVAFWIGAANGSGAPASNQYASAFTAAAMSEPQHADLYAAMQNGYLAAVGAAL